MQPGSVVFLKSGGPALTLIEATETDGTVLWFLNQMIQSKVVPLIALTEDDPDVTLQIASAKVRARLSKE